MKKTNIPKNYKTAKIPLLLALIVFFSFSTIYAQTQSETSSGISSQRAAIDINLIIDGSSSLTGVKDEILIWISAHLDQILAEGDRVTVWSAGAAARVVYSGRIDGEAEMEAVKRSIRDISPSGNNADFTGALREAASRQSSPFSYTLLISTSPTALSSVLSGSAADLLRYSRVEEFPQWRALVVGQNLEGRVKRAAAAFIDAH